MEKSWFNLILSKGELEYRCGLSKSMDSRLGLVENTIVNEDSTRNDTDKNIHDCSDNSSYYIKVDQLVDIKGIWNFIFDETFLIKDTQLGQNFELNDKEPLAISTMPPEALGKSE
ncbi:hypothetical protein Goari_014657 [Gossypium aridum]|uniref:Uncharacterized protein n=1 Tax=Gossypium aridum TaxID=34290 RepID=A0A7J8XJL4_GOSAI|nr:hypothetical protein [Gossypium aridum]